MAKVTTLLRTVARLGPVAYPAAKKLIVMLRENPELARHGQDLAGRFVKARSARSRPEGLRRSVRVLRGQAERALSSAAGPDDVARAERWLGQADKLDGAIDLMAIHDRKRQEQDATVIEARIEELFAEIFTAMVESGSTADDGGSGASRLLPGP